MIQLRGREQGSVCTIRVPRVMVTVINPQDKPPRALLEQHGVVLRLVT